MYRSPILAFITIVSAHCLCAEDRFEQKPIEYSLTKAENPVSRLQTKLKKGELKWTPENKTGFLNPRFFQNKFSGEKDFPKLSTSPLF